jgi:predicted AAA+ superfamily ATPase
LSYKEFLKFRKKQSSDKEFYKYLEYGSLPGIHNFDLRREIIYEYLNSILNTIVLKDVVKRFEVRNVALLEALIKFTFDNIGSTFSAKSISDYLKSQKLSVGVETILNYLSYLESTHLLYKVSRYDIKGKRHLEIYEKYYLADIAFRHALLGFKFDDINDYLENIVFIELLRRGYEVSVGKIGDLEIDFIAVKNDIKLYIQVSYLLSSKEVFARELEPLRQVKDAYPKYILSMDNKPASNIEGILLMNLLEFLLV